MLHEFLRANRLELAARCRIKVAARPSPRPTATELEFGVPVLIDQLVDMLRAEQVGPRISEPATLPSEIGKSAVRHGAELLRRGFTVDQVVHDYGDLCQALTELAHEKQAAISVDEFHTFNRCLDAAIAGAVTEFGRQRDDVISKAGQLTVNERLGSLAHELRNLLNSATLAFSAIKGGHGAIRGATGAVLERSHEGLRKLIDGALVDVRLRTGLQPIQESTPLGVILEEVRIAAQLDADARKVTFTVEIEPGLSVSCDRQMLSSALANLLQNAFKFTRPSGHVSLHAYRADGHVLVDITDECGGLPPGKLEDLFRPFEQRASDRTGVGLGLSISRRGERRHVACPRPSGNWLRVHDRSPRRVSPCAPSLPPGGKDATVRAR